MAKYLKRFNTHAEYNAYANSNNMIKSNVSFCLDNREVHFNPFSWSDEYMQTVALEDGTISFNILKNMETDKIASISYSTDNGNTWTTTNNQNGKSANLQITVNVENGDKILWKGNAQQLGYLDEEDFGDYIGSFFSSTCDFNAMGNVMSLLYGDNFKNQTTISNTACFCKLFSDYSEELECNIVNAMNLSLPATTISNACYYHMFGACTSLVTAPELPATTLDENCYMEMFFGCTSLIEAPELPALTLANNCYNGMFAGCTSLVTPP